MIGHDCEQAGDVRTHGQADNCQRAVPDDRTQSCAKRTPLGRGRNLCAARLRADSQRVSASAETSRYFAAVLRRLRAASAHGSVDWRPGSLPLEVARRLPPSFVWKLRLLATNVSSGKTESCRSGLRVAAGQLTHASPRPRLAVGLSDSEGQTDHAAPRRHRIPGLAPVDTNVAFVRPDVLRRAAVARVLGGAQ